MLRASTKLIRYAYGYNGDGYSKYNPRHPWQTEPIPIKDKFQIGDEPQYMLDAKLKFDENYKPYKMSATNHGFLISVCVVFSYLSLRYERIREKQEKTITHQFAI